MLFSGNFPYPLNEENEQLAQLDRPIPINPAELSLLGPLGARFHPA